MKDGYVYVYERVNQSDGPRYVGYVVLNGEFWGVRFNGDDYNKVLADATHEYESTREKREATIKAREESRVKAAQTRAKKKETE